VALEVSVWPLGGPTHVLIYPGAVIGGSFSLETATRASCVNSSVTGLHSQISQLLSCFRAQSTGL